MSKEGRIVESTGSWYKVAEKSNSKYVDCRLPGRFRLNEAEVTNPVAVGDYVVFSTNEDSTGTIEKIKERTNYVIRKATHGRQGEQILAANIDRTFVIQSIKKPRLKEGFINRFLVTCEAYELHPCIVVNKMDLATSRDLAYVEHLEKLYNRLGYTFFKCSIKSPESLEPIKNELKDRTSVFIGPSGVGKTSLLNHLDPAINRPVAKISDYSSKGTHTTTYAKLLPLDFGGYLVDTPGIREFGLVNIEPWELSLFFPEMIEPRQECRFNNCTHSHEPDCGVMKALEEGYIDPGRYESYLNILDSLE